MGQIIVFMQSFQVILYCSAIALKCVKFLNFKITLFLSFLMNVGFLEKINCVNAKDNCSSNILHYALNYLALAVLNRWV